MFAADTVAAEFAASNTDNSEYDAILSLDETLFEQLSDGWHGGLTIDNAVHPDDGDANVGADARYQHDGRLLLTQLQAVSDDIYLARMQYSHPLFSPLTASGRATTWRVVSGAGYEHDQLDYAAAETQFEDRDSDASLGLALDHEFDEALLTAMLQSRWRRFERRGDTLVLEERTALNVEKDFRTLALTVAAYWNVDQLDHSLWAQVSRVTDRDVSVCIDQTCLVADIDEDSFSLYEFVFDQTWYLTARHDAGVSLVTQLAGYTSSADHLPSNYQFSIGGMYSVRGYDEGLAGGDEAAFWRNELRLPWQADMALFGAGKHQYGYVFYDWGMAWQHAVDITLGATTFELLPQDSSRLRGAGIGLDLVLARAVSLRIEYAVALATMSGLTDEGDTSLHARVDWRAF